MTHLLVGVARLLAALHLTGLANRLSGYADRRSYGKGWGER